MKSSKRRSIVPAISLMLSLMLGGVAGSQTSQSTGVVTVPRLVNFSGSATDARGKGLPGAAGVTFAIYREQHDGAPLWMETQNVNADAKGNFTVQLGATKSEGLPLDLFSSGEARWLGVRINGGEEQPRVLLLSVPYALKAADAETLGGLPLSAFVLAAPTSGSVMNSGTAASPYSSATSAATSNVTTTGGTVNALPLFTTGTNVQSSALSQTGSGATARIGIGTAAPTTTLDIHGGAAVRGTLVLPASGVATAAAGKSSEPVNLAASSFSSATAAAVGQTFQLKVEPANNNTATPGSTLNLLYGSGANAPAETGLRIGPKGIIAFAPGQTFPGGNGSVTSVGLAAPATDFTVTGSPVTTAGTLKFAWNVAPTSASTANAIVKRDATGSFNAGAIAASLGVSGLSAAAGTPAVSGGNSGGGYGVYGVATGTTGQGVYGESFGTANANGLGPDGVHGVTHSSAGAGVAGLSDGAGGLGIYGQGIGYGVYGIAAASSKFLLASGTGVYGTSFSGNGVQGVSGSGPGVSASSGSGYGVSATSTNGNAYYAGGNATQDRASGGWAKAMVQVGTAHTVNRCFNSTLLGAAATTPPCGFGISYDSEVGVTIDFGFEVDDRFYSATMATCQCGTLIPDLFATPSSTNVNQIRVGVYQAGTSNQILANWYLIVY